MFFIFDAFFNPFDQDDKYGVTLFQKKLEYFFLFGLFWGYEVERILIIPVALSCSAPSCVFVEIFVFPFFNPGILVVYWLFIGWYKEPTLLEDHLDGPSLVLWFALISPFCEMHYF